MLSGLRTAKCSRSCWAKQRSATTSPHPPAVVDKADDSLANQHRGHMNDLDSTANKLWDTARRVDDPALRDLYFIAALCLEHRKLDAVQIISCCTLVRSKKYCSVADFWEF